MSRIGALPAALLALLLLAGCRSPVGVDRPGADAVYAGLRANAITRGVPSGATRIVLGRRGLEGTWERHPPEALERLLDAAGADHRRDEVLALAELHYLACRDGWGEEHALAAAAAAWAFLFDGSLGPLPDPWL
ncbi:MAG: hypothetical protein L6R43_16120, partial [Planctomycetes bacterium]|nr:hypothetical protein [Planctomycetota bacterium]